MPYGRRTRTTGELTRSRRRSTKASAFGERYIATQISEAFRRLEAEGILTGQSRRVSARIDHGLLTAAASKVGSSNTTEVIQSALAAFVAADPFVEWFLSGKDRLPPDFELAI